MAAFSDGTIPEWHHVPCFFDNYHVISIDYLGGKSLLVGIPFGECRELTAGCLGSSGLRWKDRAKIEGLIAKDRKKPKKLSEEEKKYRKKLKAEINALWKLQVRTRSNRPGKVTKDRTNSLLLVLLAN